MNKPSWLQIFPEMLFGDAPNAHIENTKPNHKK